MMMVMVMMMMMVMMVMVVMANQRGGQVDGEHRVHDPPLQHQLHLDPLLRLASIHQCECPVLDHILENKEMAETRKYETHVPV